MSVANPPSENHAQNHTREEFLSTGDPFRVHAARTAAVDEALVELHAQVLAPAFTSPLALIAVGGYGRRELFPHSDIDLLILVDQTPAAARKEAMSEFIRNLWDRGLRLSHSVHTIAECRQLHDTNIELNISLLDERFLAGDRSFYDQLASALPRFLQSRRNDLVRHLARLTHARHAKYHHTIHHLEPNVKETPGGLRDLHLLWWLSKLRANPQEVMSTLEEPRAFLYRARSWLHYEAGRDNNHLNFESQDQIADIPAMWGNQRPSDAAAWMRHYYRNVREIHRAALQELETSESASSSLLRSFVDWRSRLSNSNFTVAKDRVLLRTPQQLDQDPTILLLLLQFLARHGVLLAADSERRIAAAMPQLRNWYQESRGVWPLLREALGQPYAAQALRSLHSAGALTAILPEWEEIDCLVVRDFYHRYTVDEHTLIAIENLLALRDTKDPARRRFANLLSELESPSLLVFALLFHDTGKADGLKGHAQESAEIAGRAATRLGMSASDRETAMFLVEQHLALSGVINSRDLEDPVTARDIAARVRTLEWLKQLTLLTYADISAVNPTAMTPWRLEQLWRVYLLGFRELTRELETDRIHGYQAAEDQSGFLEGLPVRYLRTHTAQDIAVHSEMSRRAKVAGVSIDLHRVEGAWSLTLVTGDRPFLFASIAGALSSFGMNILKAEAFANARGEVVDGFVFADPDRTLELNPQEVDRLRVALERVILGRIDVRELLSRRPKAAPPTRRSRIKPSVTFDSQTSATATLVEVVAEDRPGLLYDLASALSSAGCNIEVVLIDTEAHRALDVFYVTAEGAKLTSDLCEKLREQIASACQV